jgi:superfamily I DNA and/or RNA helicase
MTDFLEESAQISELLRLWKATLLTEEAIYKTLLPVSSDIAQLEGRNYFKYPLLRDDSVFSDFLFGDTSQLSIPVHEEQLPFLKFLQEQDRRAKKFRQPLEHDFMVGFPVLYYRDRQGKNKLATIFKFSLSELLYQAPPNLTDITLDEMELPPLQLKQELNEEAKHHEQFWIDEFFLEEELEVPDEVILDFRKIVKTEKLQPRDFLVQFCQTILGAEEEYQEKQDGELCKYLLLSIHRLIVKRLQFSQTNKGIRVFPFALIYELENIQPTKQLQNDLDDILSQDLMSKLREKHPAYSYLFGGNEEEDFATTSIGQYNRIQLTTSQNSAINAVKKRSFTTIKGPPGTGKTHIIRNLSADHFVRFVQHLKSPDEYATDLGWVSLITSSNNRAVDNALEGMELESCLPVHLRVGSRIVLFNDTLNFLQTYAQRLGEKGGHQNISKFYQGQKDLDKLVSDIKKAVEEKSDNQSTLTELRYEAYCQARRNLDAWVVCNKRKLLNIITDLIDDIQAKRGLRTIKKPSNLRMLLTAFPIVGCTLLSLRNFFTMEEEIIGLVIVDEAGQCVPSFLLPALIRSQKSVLIGDTKQLEPVVRLRESEIELIRNKRGIPLHRGKSSFFSSFLENPKSGQHIAEDACNYILSLQEHFRCQQSIIQVCIELCNYQLQVHTPLDKGGIPLQYLEVTGGESRYGSSWSNLLEVEKVVSLLQLLLLQNVKLRDIAVLTPYKGQLNHINFALKKKRIPFSSSTEIDRFPDTITTGTVHRFQGGERPVVIFSHVITSGTPLFLNSRLNLLNVALSRAQKKFILVGSLDAMSRGPYTNLLRKHMLESGEKLTV